MFVNINQISNDRSFKENTFCENCMCELILSLDYFNCYFALTAMEKYRMFNHCHDIIAVFAF